MRALPFLLALLLGGTTAFLVSCGGDRSNLIPAGDAGDLTAALDDVAAATRSGKCTEAGQAVSRAQGVLIKLPSSVDPRLKRRLQSGVANLRKRVPQDCQQTTSTQAPTTSTQAPAPTDTTPTDTTPTETTQTETTPTDTTPTDTATTPTTPTPTIPGDTTGGTPGGTG